MENAPPFSRLSRASFPRSVRRSSFFTRPILLDTMISRHANLTRSVVNNFGLVYHWQGTGIGLKPVLLTGHQGPLDSSYLNLSFLRIHFPAS